MPYLERQIDPFLHRVLRLGLGLLTFGRARLRRFTYSTFLLLLANEVVVKDKLVTVADQKIGG